MTLLRKPHHKRLTRSAFRIRRIRKCLGTKKPAKGSYRAVQMSLDSVCAALVKLEGGFWCVQCKADGVPSQGILDAGHVYPKGMFPAVRFDRQNLYPQCRFHNTLHISRPEYYMTWHIGHVGEAAHDALHERAVARGRLTLEEMRALLLVRTRELDEASAHAAALV